MGTIVYGDFSCPFSYLASWRADLLVGTDAVVEWRAVEHAPQTPLTGLRLDGDGSRDLAREWRQVQELLLPGEELPGRPPALLPSTRAAVAGFAEAVGAGVADQVRRLLFRAYWVEGLDIGNPEILRALLAAPIRAGHAKSAPLREFGYAVSPARGPVTSEAYRRIRAWHDAWTALGDRTIPALVQDGGVVTGVPALLRLGELAGERVADPHDESVAALPATSERFWY
ncbi:MAG TPA: DsbA family protein [Segeticoccus sp.]|uniref:DsbA family oxidoreductase n=1 Tax=Segeticoccus sp. TaxID=2706531 RepID=UPI002D806085|nr:DsbA family protein [Segeticoccus sp.]HET8600224.1 DsbA family protein [Segeticoccus sp.]